MKIRLILLLMSTLSAIILNGCTETPSDEYCENPGISCTDPSATIESCCTATSCYLIYDGEKYACDGTDCTAARDQVINACVASALNVEIKDNDLEFMKNRLDEVTQNLLLEARAASGCTD